MIGSETTTRGGYMVILVCAIGIGRCAAEEPGDFGDLPPLWQRQPTDADYIQPRAVAENYHYAQRHRPQFHYTALHGHLGDATGLVVHQGRYHLFYMFDPWQRARRWHKCWGHAVSYDLLHWEQRPPVTDTIVDGRSGSGCGVVDWHNSSGLRTGPQKTLVIFYTDYWRGTCIKYSNDGGDSWQYHPRNPVLSGFHDIRDPLVFWYDPDQAWRMVRYEQRGFAFYRSENLIDWVYLSRIEDPQYYECPDMFQLHVQGAPDKKKWVLINGNGTYLIGEFNGHEFRPHTDLLRVDYGHHLYATQTWKPTRGCSEQVIQLAFMGYSKKILRTWEGQMCFPCALRGCAHAAEAHSYFRQHGQAGGQGDDCQPAPVVPAACKGGRDRCRRGNGADRGGGGRSLRSLRRGWHTAIGGAQPGEDRHAPAGREYGQAGLPG